MKKLLALLLVILLTVVACNTSEEPEDQGAETPSETETEQPTDEDTEGDTETESDDEPSDEEDDGYTEVDYEAVVPVVTHVFDENEEMMLIHMETSADPLNQDEALMMSLQLSDQTTNEAFTGLVSVEIADKEATLNFEGGQPFVSLASAEHMMLDQMFYQLGAFYNIDTFIFTVDGEAGVDYGQVGFIEALPVEDMAVTGVVEVTNETLLEGYQAPVYRPIRDMVPLQLDSFEETLNKTATFVAPEGYKRVFEGVTIVDVKETGAQITLTVTGEIEEDTALVHALAIMATPFDFDTLTVVNESMMTRTKVTLY